VGEAEAWTLGSGEIEYVTRAIWAEPETPAGYGIVRVMAKVEVWPLRSTGGRLRVVYLMSTSAGPVITTANGSTEMPLTL